MVERAATAQMLAEIQLRETDLPRWLARRDAELGRAVPSFAALAYFISDRAYLKPEDACRLIADLAELPANRSNQ
jgi:hypothetical protein